jgi:hypothetical protein
LLDCTALHCTALHNNELPNLYSSPNVVRVIILRKMRWTGHVACMEEMRVNTKFWSENLKGRDHLGYLFILEDNIKIDVKRNGL